MPVAKMREGYYSDKYFVRAREVLLADNHRARVTMQIFGKSQAAILKLCAVEWPELQVHALHDGDEVEPWETVLLIEGPYDAFAHLETLYLGVLSRQGNHVLPGHLAGAAGVSTDAQASWWGRRAA